MMFVRALHFLHEADPTGEVPDPPELGALEGNCLLNSQEGCDFKTSLFYFL